MLNQFLFHHIVVKLCGVFYVRPTDVPRFLRFTTEKNAPSKKGVDPSNWKLTDPCGEKSAGVNSTMKTPSKGSRKIEELCIDDGVKVSYRTVQKIVADRKTVMNL